MDMTEKICKKCGNYQCEGKFCTNCGIQLFPDIGFTDWIVHHDRNAKFNAWSGKPLDSNAKEGDEFKWQKSPEN
jgi:hypothetical protein